MPSFAVIIPAAGRSLRFGGPQNKLLTPLHGKPVIAHTVAAFLHRTDVTRIILPTSDPRTLAEAIGTLDARLCYCAGGENRAESVRAALSLCNVKTEWVAIHDGARPLVSQGLIDKTLAAAVEHGAAAPAMAVQLTIKQAAGPLPARVEKTIPREKLYAMQTPQIMRTTALRDAFARCPLPLDQVTDDAQLLELIGQPAWLVEGEARNLKITTTLDLATAEAVSRS